MRPSLALFQPDIPQNTGTLLRLGACVDCVVHLIEPAGFVLSNEKLRRAGMDYIDQAQLQRHASWEHFMAFAHAEGRRILLLTTKAETNYTDMVYHSNDLLLLGRESSGVPDKVHQAVDARLKIPMVQEARSINMALTGAIVLSEALRQTAKMHTATLD